MTDRTRFAAAAIEGDLVVLDLVRGDYRLGLGLLADPDPDARAAALAAALGPEGAREVARALAAPPPPRPQCERLGEGARAPGAAERADFALALAALPIGFRALSFRARLPRAPAPDFGAPDEALLARADAFERLRPFAPRPGLCLEICWIARRFHARAGRAPAWVFGVRAWPFEAHCWLQAGETVLGDSAERVARFTPILSV